jgi:hypothetical protein
MVGYDTGAAAQGAIYRIALANGIMDRVTFQDLPGDD